MSYLTTKEVKEMGDIINNFNSQNSNLDNFRLPSNKELERMIILKKNFKETVNNFDPHDILYSPCWVISPSFKICP